MKHPELETAVVWRATSDDWFPLAALLDNKWWVLRLNDFPDHPLYTLFVDGERRFDVDDTPTRWDRSATRSAPLSSGEANEALSEIRSLRAYGSEVGMPCDNPFCCG